MSRELDEKIVKWLGWETIEGLTTGFIMPFWYWKDANGNKVEVLPYFRDNDSYAITLLPELVKRGYGVSLVGSNNEYAFDIVLGLTGGEMKTYAGQQETYPTIAQAITSAIEQLIR